MILIFRKYKNNGHPDDSYQPIERECNTLEEKESYIHELQAEGWEYEGAI